MHAEGDSEPLEDLPDDAPPEMSKPFEFWAFEVEHLFPQKRGGSRAPANLTAACKSCNKYKDVLINFSDLPVETFLTSSSKPENIKSAFGGVKKFALLWRQAGCCARCDLPFYEAQDERLILLRRNDDDAYHFFNVEITCGACGEQDPKGVELRA
jgi:5-methylcytosine-specific restriction endonuclease McrA